MELKRRAEEEGPGVKPKKAVQQPLKVFRDGVGKYLNLQGSASSSKVVKSDELPAKKPKKDSKYGFGSFSAW